MTDTATYRTRPAHVEAVQWIDHDASCAAVYEFLGIATGEHLDHELFEIPGGTYQSVTWRGGWIVRYPGGRLRACTSATFRAEFEVTPTAPERPPLREVTQSHLVDNEKGIPGDCLRAAVASLLDRQDTSVPHFIAGEIDGRVWWYALKGWAADNGWTVSRRGLLPRQENVPLPKFGIACGPSERGHSHAVVAVDGQIVWDPHPSQAGILRVKEVIEFEAVGQVGGDHA